MNKKSIIGFVLVLLIAVLAVLGIYLISKSKSSFSNQTPPPPPKTTDVRPGTSTTTTTKHEFTNPTGKYGFEYPEEWKAVVHGADQKNTLFGPDADGSSGLGGVEIFEKDSFQDIDGEWTNKGPITIDGVNGSRMQYKGIVNGEAVVLMDGNLIYNIYINSEKAEDIQLFDELVASFKFIKSGLKTNGYTHEFLYKNDETGLVVGQQLIFVSPEGTTSTIPLPIATKISIGARIYATGTYAANMGEDITSFDMPLSPDEKNVIYFSTFEPLQPYTATGEINNDIIVNRIYVYNVVANTLKEIYKEQNTSSAPEGAKMWRTVGIDGTKIIILYDHMGNSPGPCWRVFYNDVGNLAYIDIENLSAGLQSYTVGQDRIDADKAESEDCETELK